MHNVPEWSDTLAENIATFLTLPVPFPEEEEKFKLNFYFHTFLWYLRRFNDGLKGLHKTF